MSRRRSFQKLIRTSIFPVALPFFVAILVGLTIATILRILLAPGDAVVVQVLPIGKNDVVTVQVEGAVRQPGVYALPTGSTVGDAVQQAGGPTEGVELAAGAEETAVVDGQFIVIPESASASAELSLPIDINQASASQLEVLPGIGPVIASRIVAYRETNGPFTSLEQLAEVSGISLRMVNELEPLIVVQPS